MYLRHTVQRRAQGRRPRCIHPLVSILHIKLYKLPENHNLDTIIEGTSKYQTMNTILYSELLHPEFIFKQNLYRAYLLCMSFQSELLKLFFLGILTCAINQSFHTISQAIVKSVVNHSMLTTMPCYMMWHYVLAEQMQPELSTDKSLPYV